MPRYVLRYDAREFHARLPRRAAPRFLVRLLAERLRRSVSSLAWDGAAPGADDDTLVVAVRDAVRLELPEGSPLAPGTAKHGSFFLPYENAAAAAEVVAEVGEAGARVPRPAPAAAQKASPAQAHTPAPAQKVEIGRAHV